VGHATWFDSGVNNKTVDVDYIASTTFYFIWGAVIAGTAFAANDGLKYNVRAPIKGWG
jgi:hypothetical protein